MFKCHGGNLLPILCGAGCASVAGVSGGGGRGLHEWTKNTMISIVPNLGKLAQNYAEMTLLNQTMNSTPLYNIVKDHRFNYSSRIY